MDKQTKIIFVLLALITAVTIFLVLKITGVIKPVELKPEDIKTESVENIPSNNNYKSSFEYKESFQLKLLMFIYTHLLLTRIVIFIIVLIINIGIGKLYAKLSMPDWCVYMQYIFPLISFITSIPYVGGIISLIIAILEIITLAYYFGSVGMSKLWAICPTVSVIIISIGFVKNLNASILMGKFTGTQGSGFIIIGYILLLIFAVSYIIANIKVGKKLGMGVGFIVGLVLLPAIFQPILGYIGEKNRSMHKDDYNFDIE